MKAVDRPVRRCSFCGKKQGEVRLVAGPSDVYICHLCVALCSEILEHEGPGEPGAPRIRTEITSSPATPAAGARAVSRQPDAHPPLYEACRTRPTSRVRSARSSPYGG